MFAKRFFFVSAGILCLAATHHLGATNARAQSPSFRVVGENTVVSGNGMFTLDVTAGRVEASSWTTGPTGERMKLHGAGEETRRSGEVPPAHDETHVRDELARGRRFARCSPRVARPCLDYDDAALCAPERGHGEAGSRASLHGEPFKAEGRSRTVATAPAA